MRKESFSISYVGRCTGCDGSIPAYSNYVDYPEFGTFFHQQCDPDTGVVLCRWGCGTETDKREQGKQVINECDPCARKLHWWLWESSIPQLALALRPPDVPRGFRASASVDPVPALSKVKKW